MIEGTTLFSYSGCFCGTNATWAWTPVASSIPVTVNGYTYTWTVPIGAATASTDHVVIQAEGYAPLTDVFVPCADLMSPVSGDGRYC
jgi:hypothetical protein